MSTTWPTYYLALAFAGMCLVWFQRRKAGLPYPPGPPAEPIIGHLRIIPSNNPDFIFRQWSRIYGKPFYR
ncbi:hypothetical protein BDQ17DRAFT_1484448 [Cyathus striatus]|nr:hypothetical protein BDQ17DRAFT_1484448 [Cyathus striatus]